MNKEQIRAEIARIINASCIDPPTREEPDRPINCHADCGLCKADQILALFPLWVMQSRPNPSPFPIRRRGHWVFKTDKLTPLQVKACVCQQCPFPGELETKCDWCDNPKMMEFLRVAISAMEDFYTQENKIDGNALPSAAYDEYFTPSQGEGGLLSPHEISSIIAESCKCNYEPYEELIRAQHALDQQHEPLTDEEHEIVNQEWEKAHAVELALKEQMERVMGVIDKQARTLLAVGTTEALNVVYSLKALKAELESE